MCGIFAYLNYNVERKTSYILEVLLNGLRRLEYRGYDSAGISIYSDLSSVQKDGCESFRSYFSPPVFRHEGKLESLVRSVYSELDKMEVDLEKPFLSHAAIAHTRWTTHSMPASRDSRPQSSGEFDEFMVVQSGIITNYEDLKTTLVHKAGFMFTSDTDPEVIPKLAKFVFDKARDAKEAVTFSQVVIEVMRQLEGAYALIFKSSHYPNELVACKRGSTLMLGVNQLGGEASSYFFHDVKSLTAKDNAKELFISSDLCSIVENTKNYTAIQDNELVHIKDGIISINHLYKDGTANPQAVFMHGMKNSNPIRRLIHDQTTNLAGLLLEGFQTGCNNPNFELKRCLQSIRFRRIVILGHGGSFNAAHAAKMFVEEVSGIGVTVEYTEEFFGRQYVLSNEDLVVLFNDTSDTEEMMDQLYKKGAHCIAPFRYKGKQVCFTVTNQCADVTESFSSKVLLIIMMTLSCWPERLSATRNESIFKAVAELPVKILCTLNLECQMKELAKSIERENLILVIGRGLHLGTGLECMRLFYEIGIFGECIREETLRKRGPLEYRSCPLLIIATRDNLFEKNAETVRNLDGREGRIVVICNVGDRALFTAYACEVVEVPAIPYVFQSIIIISAIRMLVHHLAVLTGRAFSNRELE